MPRATACKVCNATNQEELEAIGLEAMDESISWREAARRADFTHHAGFKNHMVEHYVDRQVRAAEEEAADETDRLINQTVIELRDAMRIAPIDVKALYAAAIHNLLGLKQTKPSQQHLIMALRSIQEMTGMKNEQRLLLQFAEHMYATLPAAAEKALPAPVPAVLDVTEVTDE